MADALIKLAFRRDPDGDERVLAEAKDIVRDYLYRKLTLIRASRAVKDGYARTERASGSQERGAWSPR